MSRIPGFRGEYLWELEIAERQLTALADAFPEEMYAWRPAESARSVSEVFAHIVAGNFMLLDLLGAPVPADLYPEVKGEGRERFASLVKANDHMDQTIRDKETLRALLVRALSAVRQSVTNATDEQFEGPAFFFGEQSTVRRGHLRALVHMHEHMGQLMGYIRMNGLPVPWPDWRPDRR